MEMREAVMSSHQAIATYPEDMTPCDNVESRNRGGM